MRAGDQRGVADCCAAAGAALRQRGASEAALTWLGQAVQRYHALKQYPRCMELLEEEPALAQVGGVGCSSQHLTSA